jgi:hypothetical protein
MRKGFWMLLWIVTAGCSHLRDQVAQIRYGESMEQVRAELGGRYREERLVRGTTWTFTEGSDVCEVTFRSDQVTVPPACRRLAAEDELASKPPESAESQFYREYTATRRTAGSRTEERRAASEATSR